MTQRAKQIRAERYERSVLTLDRKAAQDETRTVPAALSSEEPVARWFGNEVLVHEEAAVDLSRANGLGLPLLWNHDDGTPIGRIEGIRLDPDRVLRGVLRFSANPKASEIWADVREGFLNAVSIGYRVEKWEEQKDPDIVRVTRWQPIEASVVSVPADASVGLNRKHGDQTMKDDGQQTENGAGREAVAIDQYRNQYEAGKKAAEREIRAREAARMMEIEEIFDLPNVPRNEFYRSLKRDAISKAWSPDQVRKTIMAALAGEIPEAPVEMQTPDLSRVTDQQLGVGRRSHVQAGVDALDKLAEITTNALLVRSGICTDAETVRKVEASGYRDRSLLRLAEEHLRAKNVDTRALDNKGIAASVLTRTSGPHTASDFPSILANVANKSVLEGWQSAGTTWQQWCRTGSLSDFKQATIAALGGFPDLDKIPRGGGPYQHKSMDDIHETAQMATYGALFGISRQALIDDDLMTLTDVPRQMGIAAADKIDQLAYNELITSDGSTASVTGRVLTQDNTALFHANHSNYIASSSGAAPSVATLNVAEAAMMRQKVPLPSGDTSKRYIAVSPAYLIVPPELKATAQVLVASQWDPAGTTASVSKRDSPNPWNGRLTVVSSPILTLTSGWYLAAGTQSRVSTVKVFFLNGQQAPYLEQQDKWESDGVGYKVRIDAVARALDFRGLYFNYGA